MVDAGEDWRGELANIYPAAIFVTHAHPDHAFGLKDGAPCPLSATDEAWTQMDDYPIYDGQPLKPRSPIMQPE